jgi:hypothetical protein
MWRGFFVSLGPFYTVIKLSMHGVGKNHDYCRGEQCAFWLQELELINIWVCFTSVFEARNSLYQEQVKKKGYLQNIEKTDWFVGLFL